MPDRLAKVYNFKKSGSIWQKKKVLLRANRHSLINRNKALPEGCFLIAVILFSNRMTKVAIATMQKIKFNR